MRLIESIWTKARSKIRTIVLPEGDEPRTVAAAEILRKEGLAEPILIGKTFSWEKKSEYVKASSDFERQLKECIFEVISEDDKELRVKFKNA